LSKENLGKKTDNDDILEISTGCYWRRYVPIAAEGRAENVKWNWNNSSKIKSGIKKQNSIEHKCRKQKQSTNCADCINNRSCLPCVWVVDLLSLDCRDFGLESHWGNGCFSLCLSCCIGGTCGTSWSHFQRSCTGCACVWVSVCVCVYVYVCVGVSNCVWF
jgi:hypothetical protein